MGFSIVGPPWALTKSSVGALTAVFAIEEGAETLPAFGWKGREFSEFPKIAALWIRLCGPAPSKIEPRAQLDKTLVAGRGRRIRWRHDDVSEGVHYGRGVQIRHV